MTVNDALYLIDKRIDELKSLQRKNPESDMYGSFLMEAHTIKMLILHEKIDSVLRETKNV